MANEACSSSLTHRHKSRASTIELSEEVGSSLLQLEKTTHKGGLDRAVDRGYDCCHVAAKVIPYFHKSQVFQYLDSFFPAIAGFNSE